MEAEARAMISELVTEKPRTARRGGLGTALIKRLASPGGVELSNPPRKLSNRPMGTSVVPTLDRGLGTAIHELFAPLGGVEIPIPPRRKSRRPIPKFD